MADILDLVRHNYVAFISIFVIVTIIACLLLKRIHQPYIISYIIVGAILGPQGLQLISNTTSIQHLGELGIILLLFFIGMEISLPEFKKQWKVAMFGTMMQVGASVFFMLIVGYFFGRSVAVSVALGFVIALSSSAVIIKLLEEKQLIDSRIGKNVLSILLTQDIIIVPMLIITSLMGGKGHDPNALWLMLVGGLVMIGIIVFVYQKNTINLPFSKTIEEDHEIQVFIATLFCFGGALISTLFGLSPALGAFIGGLVMHAGKATEWIHDTLNSFRVVFVAVFFVSVGLQIDFEFIQQNLFEIFVVIILVYITNHLLNTLILRLFSCSWKEAILGGALLAQVGELSFLVSSTAFAIGIFTDFDYKFAISLISLTLIFSPFYIAGSEFLIKRYAKRISEINILPSQSAKT